MPFYGYMLYMLPTQSTHEHIYNIIIIYIYTCTYKTNRHIIIYIYKLICAMIYLHMNYSSNLPFFGDPYFYSKNPTHPEPNGSVDGKIIELGDCPSP